MTPLLPQVLKRPGDLGLIRLEQREAQQIPEVCDVPEEADFVTELQQHREFAKVSYECEVLRSPAEVSTTTSVRSQRDRDSKLRGQISVTEAAERIGNQVLRHKTSVETLAIVEESRSGLEVQTGKDRSPDSAGLMQVRESEETLKGREFNGEITGEIKPSAITVATEVRKDSEKVETEKMLLAEDLKDHDMEHVSALLLVRAEETFFMEKTAEVSPAQDVPQGTGTKTEIEMKTSPESKRGRSRPPEKVSVRKHEVTEQPKSDIFTNTERRKIRKDETIKPQNSVTDIELKHPKLVQEEKTEPVLLLAGREEEESKATPGSRELSKTSEIKEHKETRELRESRDPKESRETKEPTETSKTSKLKASKTPNESQEPTELREISTTRELKESRETSDTREVSESRAPKGARELREWGDVPPQRGETAKTEGGLLKDPVETESSGKRRIPLQTTVRGTETTSVITLLLLNWHMTPSSSHAESLHPASRGRRSACSSL